MNNGAGNKNSTNNANNNIEKDCAKKECAKTSHKKSMLCLRRNLNTM